MSERFTRFFASRWGIILAGAAIGVLAPLLQKAGNPTNMGICVACFVCESGTPNAVGLAGLGAGLRRVLDRGVETIRAHEEAVTQRLIDGLRDIPGVTVYGGLDATRQTATVSFNIAGMEPSEVGLRLDEEYGIMCRVGPSTR